MLNSIEAGGRIPPAFTAEELAELRGKFAAWDEDWNAPGMEAYDEIGITTPRA